MKPAVPQSGERRPAPPPHPKSVLLHLVSNPEDMEQIYGDLKRIHPYFPEHGSTLVLWRLLFLAGLPCPFDPIPGRMADQLGRMGVRPLPPAVTPKAGDFFAVGDEEKITALGVVAKVPLPVAGEPPGWFMAADHLMGETYRPYRRKITGDPHHPDVVHFFRPFG